MPGEPIKTSKPYLTIKEGELKKDVEEGTPGAIRRDWEVDGNSGTKYEIPFGEWTGLITSISFYDSKFGTQNCNIEFDDVIISIDTAKKYFTSFAQRIFNVDMSQQVTIKPYDFESEDNKQMTGICIKQNGVKLENFFYDFKNKKSLNKYPQPTGKEKDKDDWKVFFIGVKKFLVQKIIDDIKIPEENASVNLQTIAEHTKKSGDLVAGHQTPQEAGEAVLKAMGKDTSKVKDEEIDITDLPF